MFPLIPKTDLFKDPDHHLVKLSPDAVWVSSVQSKDNRKRLVLQRNSQEEESVTLFETDEFLGIWWIQSGRHVVFLGLSYQTGLELICYDLVARQSNLLMKGAHVKWLEQTAEFPSIVYINVKTRGRKYFDLYQLDVTNGKMNLFYQNEFFNDYILDRQGNVRFGIKISTTGGDIVDIKDNDADIITLNQHDMMLMHRFAELKPRMSESHLYFVSSESYPCARLLSYQLKTGVIQVLAEDRQADITNVIYHPFTNKAIACSSEYHKINWMGIKSDIASHLQLIAKFKENDFRIEAQSLNNHYWLIAHLSDTKPIQYSCYQLATQELIPLFQETIKHYVSQTELMTIPARDGLKMPCYFTRSQIHGVAPLVLLIHGGPHSRESWGWQPLHQLLSNRGYHVLGINYRGSVGFGREHFRRGNGQWADSIIDDIKDAAQALVDQHIVLSDKIGLLGTSFGGFAAITCLIKYPSFFKCAVDLMGPVDLNAMIKELPSELTNNCSLLNQMIGVDVLSEQGQLYLTSISPIHQCEKVQKPLLIGHGKRDAVIKYSESVKLVEKLAQSNTPVTGVLFNNEGHQLNHADNRITWYGCVEKFYSQFLGGECEQSAMLLNSNIELLRDDFSIFKPVNEDVSVLML